MSCRNCLNTDAQGSEAAEHRVLLQADKLAPCVSYADPGESEHGCKALDSTNNFCTSGMVKKLIGNAFGEEINNKQPVDFRGSPLASGSPSSNELGYLVRPLEVHRDGVEAWRLLVEEAEDPRIP